jgi:carboxyl-terminal processing protease
MDTAQKEANIASFDAVWTTIRDRHWEPKPGGLDWNAVRTEYRPKVEAAKSTGEVRDVLREMLGRLKQTHFGIFPSDVYESAGGDGVPAGSASIGVDIRVLNAEAVVTRVDQGSPA